jgi:hypothetical protein
VADDRCKTCDRVVCREPDRTAACDSACHDWTGKGGEACDGDPVDWREREQAAREEARAAKADIDALRERLRAVTACQCGDAWRKYDQHDPACAAWVADEVLS